RRAAGLCARPRQAGRSRPDSYTLCTAGFFHAECFRTGQRAGHPSAPCAGGSRRRTMQRAHVAPAHRFLIKAVAYRLEISIGTASVDPPAGGGAGEGEARRSRASASVSRASISDDLINVTVWTVPVPSIVKRTLAIPFRVPLTRRLCRFGCDTTRDCQRAGDS